MKVFALVLLTMLLSTPLWAGDAKCPDLLKVEQMLAYRVDEHRDKVQRDAAALEYSLHLEQEARKALESKVVELEKKLAEKPKE